MQYTVNGGASDAGYFVQLASLCGVPNDSVMLYKNYFKALATATNNSEEILFLKSGVMCSN